MFCQVWIARRATRYNLTQTFPLETPRGSKPTIRQNNLIIEANIHHLQIPTGITQPQKHQLNGSEGEQKRIIVPKPNLLRFTSLHIN